MKNLEKVVKCACGSNEFLINLSKLESVGLLSCKKCAKTYFLLDSGNYWYDLIQKKYPSKVKCGKCKDEFFKLNLTYEFLENSDDVKCINIMGTCSECNSVKKLGVWEFDYSPTDLLINEPIIPCENPRIKYNLSQITCYWTCEDYVKFVSFLFELNLNVYYRSYSENGLKIELLNKEEAVKQALQNGMFYASTGVLTLTDGKRIEWKNGEIINIPGGTHMGLGVNKEGLLYYIEFSSNYIKDFKSGTVEEKSKRFKDVTKKIEEWLKQNYQSLRGRNSYDNQKENKRLFGDKFIKRP